MDAVLVIELGHLFEEEPGGEEINPEIIAHFFHFLVVEAEIFLVGTGDAVGNGQDPLDIDESVGEFFLQVQNAFFVFGDKFVHIGTVVADVIGAEADEYRGGRALDGFFKEVIRLSQRDRRLSDDDGVIEIAVVGAAFGEGVADDDRSAEGAQQFRVVHGRSIHMDDLVFLGREVAYIDAAGRFGGEEFRGVFGLEFRYGLDVFVDLHIEFDRSHGLPGDDTQ